MSELGVEALFAPIAGKKVIGLAVSGGPDSFALMVLASRWARVQSSAVRLIVYTVDHGLRPEASDEAIHVAREAEKLGLEARILRWEGDKPSNGVQAAARRARYRLMGQAMEADDAEVLVTAHHQGDQAETVLMRMAHASGLGGLAGMAAFSSVEGVAVFRPFLDVDRAALLTVVAESGIQPVQDPSNSDPHYERVRWRQALPMLGGLGLDGPTLSRLAKRAREADAALEDIAAEVFSRLVQIDGFGSMRMEREGFAHLHRAVAVKVLEKGLAAAGGDQRRHVLGQIEELAAALVVPDTFSRQTLLGCIVHRDSRHVWLVREPGRLGDRLTLVPPQTAIVWDNRFTISNDRGNLPVAVRMASEWNRKTAEALVEKRVAGPIEGLRATPLVLDKEGRILALGQHRFDDSVSVAWLSQDKRVHGKMHNGAVETPY
jgi:tRNA(Ile)-lysidine synthase